MAREDYDYLTDATKEVLTDNVKAAARGWDKCTQWIYQILSGEKKDPFAYFRSIYEGMCKGGVSTAAWDNDLEYLRIKHTRRTERGRRRAMEAFSDAFKSHNRLAERYIETIADGELSLDECKELEDLLDSGDPHRLAVRQALKQHRLKLEEK